MSDLFNTHQSLRKCCTNVISDAPLHCPQFGWIRYEHSIDIYLMVCSQSTFWTYPSPSCGFRGPQACGLRDPQACGFYNLQACRLYSLQACGLHNPKACKLCQTRLIVVTVVVVVVVVAIVVVAVVLLHKYLCLSRSEMVGRSATLIHYRCIRLLHDHIVGRSRSKLLLCPFGCRNGYCPNG